MNKSFIYILLAITLSLLLFKLFGEGVSNYNSKDFFHDYISNFKDKSLPFSIDRDKILSLNNDYSSFIEIKDSLKRFIPEELRKKQPDSKFISLYSLPENNGNIPVLVLQDLINKYDINGELYEVREVKTYLVIYNNYGKVLDYQQMAGVVIDAKETFMTINEKNIIERKKYQFKMPEDNDMRQYSLISQTIYKYKLMSNGKIKEVKKQEREGYFDFDKEGGYQFVKPLN